METQVNRIGSMTSTDPPHWQSNTATLQGRKTAKVPQHSTTSTEAATNTESDW